LKISAKKNVRLSYEQQDMLIKKLKQENHDLRNNLGGKSPDKIKSMSEHDDALS